MAEAPEEQNVMLPGIAGWLCTCLGIKSSLNSGIRCEPVIGVENPFLRGMQSSEPSFILTSTVSSTEDVARLKRRHEAIPERPRRFETRTRKDCNCHERNLRGNQHDYLAARNSFLARYPGQLGESYCGRSSSWSCFQSCNGRFT